MAVQGLQDDFPVMTNILHNKEVDNEIKLFTILHLLHYEYISIHKAHELCTEIGLFSDHWMAIEDKFLKLRNSNDNTTNKG